MISHIPAFGICGYSGSGKTTLIVGLIQRLAANGLKVGVIKHAAHGLNIDHEGKDSDRFFKAGADVLMRGPDQMFLRAQAREEIDHAQGAIDLEAALKLFGPRYDLVLLEGHKSTPLVDKVWLLKDNQEECPPEAVNVKRVLGRDEDRVGTVMEMLRTWLTEKWLATPVFAGVLIGGESRRMGRPKHLITTSDPVSCRAHACVWPLFRTASRQREPYAAAGRTWLETIAASIQPLVNKVVILGKGEIPKSLEHLPMLPDVEDGQGPLAGILAAMRWRPDVSWLFLACDMPRLTTDALRWLLANRKPGVWAILPRRAESCRWRDKTEGVEPLPGWYDSRALRLLETCRGPAGLAGHAKVATPLIPGEFAAAWTNVNTELELDVIMP